ncbi:MAG: hypothetical protein FWF05_00440 [Oscillospiraceae bacterium]|nr:hypothetical protein [Oscillospiraceae bacterium]
MRYDITAFPAGSQPEVTAVLTGTGRAPHLHGSVKLYPWIKGTLVKAELVNLPGDCVMRIGGKNGAPLFDARSNDGYCFTAVYTDRFCPAEAVGESVFIEDGDGVAGKGNCQFN